MVRRTKEEAQETRSAILEAAERAFYERGVARTTLADIATLAGVTRGAIYWHFSNKADVVQAMLDSLDDQDHKTDAAEEQPAKKGEGDKPHILEDVQTLSAVDVGVSDVIGHVVGNARQISLVLLSRSQKVHALHIERTELGFRHVANLGGVGQRISCPHTGID